MNRKISLYLVIFCKSEGGARKRTYFLRENVRILEEELLEILLYRIRKLK